MSDHPEGRNGFVNPSVKYEYTDLSLRAVLTFSGALVGVLIVVSIGLYFMIPAVLGPTRAQAPQEPWDFPAHANPDVSGLPPPPELEAIDRTAPPPEGGMHTHPIQEQIKEEEAHLNGYGWVDRDKGIVYIPIDEAMKRMAAAPGEKP